jgi:phosphinothricin acetyltransferase
MNIIDSVPSRHGAGILEILNDVIVTSTALYEYVPRTTESMVPWFEAKVKKESPVVVAVNETDAVLGFATYGSFRSFPAYKYTVEHSVYVHRDHRGRGVGTALMQRLMARAVSQDYHTMIGVVDAGNAASVALHERLGFVRAGVVRQAGFKFGAWLDAAFYQIILPTPDSPVEG